MEDKLLELKELYCKWYCPNKNKEIILNSRTDYSDCCNVVEWGDTFLPSIDFCTKCQVLEFIRFIRDEI